MRIVYEDEIARTPEIVFPWIAEPEKAMKWQKNVRGGEIIVDRPEMVGTTFREVIEEDGNTLEMHGIISKYVRNGIIGFHLTSKIHDFDVDYSVEEKEGNTKIKIEATIKWKFPMSIVSLFIRKRIEEGLTRQLKSEVQELKKLCECA
jgi:hypothetical protein